MLKIKKENEPFCCCCFGDDELSNVWEPCVFEGKSEIYAHMIAECFQLKLKTREEAGFYMMCKNCVYCLRDSLRLRLQIQNACTRTQDPTAAKRNFVEVHYNTIPNTSKIKMDADDKNSSPDSCGDLNQVTPEPQNKKMECETCGKLVSSKGALKRHMLTHSNTKDFICEICGRSFKFKHILKIHVMMHLKIKKEECKVCNKKFVTKSCVKVHMRNRHSDKEKFLCDTCDRLFKNEDVLNRHIFNCRNVVKCGICEKSFSRNSSLTRHMQIHDNVKNFVCNECGKSFRLKHHLKEHGVTHAKEKTFDQN